MGRSLGYIESVLVKTTELSDHEIRLRAMEQRMIQLSLELKNEHPFSLNQLRKVPAVPRTGITVVEDRPGTEPIFGILTTASLRKMEKNP